MSEKDFNHKTVREWMAVDEIEEMDLIPEVGTFIWNDLNSPEY